MVMSKTQRHLGAISPAVNLAILFSEIETGNLLSLSFSEYSTHNLDAT